MTARVETAARRAAWLAWPLRHPVRTCFLVAVLVAIWNLWWVANHRNLGGFGVDESSYLSEALALREVLFDQGPSGVLNALSNGSRTAPLMPLCSALLMAALGPEPTVGLAIGALLCIISSVAVAVIALRLSSASVSLVAGLVATGLPVMVISSRYYHQSTAVTAFLCVSVGALLCSARLTDLRWVLVAGMAAGLMLLSRTMAVAFVPGLVVCAAVLVEHSRRCLMNCAAGALAAFVVAGPWWFAHLGEIYDYLVGFGYGDGSREINGVPLGLRIPVRVGMILVDVRPALLVLLSIGAGFACVGVRRSRRAARPDVETGAVLETDRMIEPGRSEALDARATAAVVSVVVLGFLALVTSSNVGSWFQMPLEVLAVAPACAAIWAFATPVRRPLAVVAVAVAAANVVLISQWRPGSGVGIGDGSLNMVLLGGTEDTQALDFADVDSRFAPSVDWATREAAERDWARTAEQILDELDRVSGSDATFSFLGESRLLRAPTVGLLAGASGRGPLSVDQPLRPEGGGDGRDPFDPPDPSDAKVLVVLRTPFYLDVDRLDSPVWVDEAIERGWNATATVPTPDGGEAVILAYDG